MKGENTFVSYERLARYYEVNGGTAAALLKWAKKRRIKIPDYSGEPWEMNRGNLQCPSCGFYPNYDSSRLEYMCYCPRCGSRHNGVKEETEDEA